ncbi:hypothetical protein PHYPSEUDO_011096 [Phytophthora pseudosyringae]|uniref:Uncharacterized protein n=1 Tax=Phytophthora pseudosyringae TaxID=221518 RepID=A0A8T1W8S7_9STRA|nr:hypothetical protein PHYPSEUDO_011096 [Phytophthora pseudosyringae]
MPHALQQASAASFFPTAKELSSGVQWFKDHPVLAAAAATAVSVITYLNALELPEADVVEHGAEAAAAAASRHRRPAPIRRKGSPSLTRKGSSGATSDGKLSAAVSWCDEHGGSLTQVFEDDTPPLSRRGRRLEDSDSDEEARDDVAESCEDAFQQHRALMGGLRKSVTAQQPDADPDADAAQTESPQWGWYVPITPPQDQFQATGRDSAAVAPCPVEPPADVKAMRRTTSGQIP